MKLPHAKAASDQEWTKLGELPASQVTNVKSRKEVFEKAQTERRTVHFPKLIDLYHSMTRSRSKIQRALRAPMKIGSRWIQNTAYGWNWAKNLQRPYCKERWQFTAPLLFRQKWLPTVFLFWVPNYRICRNYLPVSFPEGVIFESGKKCLKPVLFPGGAVFESGKNTILIHFLI